MDRETLHALDVHLILIMPCFPSPETLVKNNDLDDRSIIRSWKVTIAAIANSIIIIEYIQATF